MKQPAALLATLSSLAASFVPREQPPTYRHRVRATFSHDPSAFTQGLYYEAGRDTLLESTGLYGASSARRVDLRSGRVLEYHALPDEWFGEGLAVATGGMALQLLWREGVCLVRDAKTLALRRTLPMPAGMREGWGLTSDDRGTLYASDGTSTIHVLGGNLEGDAIEVKRTVEVTAAGRPLADINDMQWIHGELWANLFRQDRLAVIDPLSGAVRCFVDLSGLLGREDRQQLGYEEVLNGIAHDARGDRLFVTGKCWPKLFEIEVEEPAWRRP
jgi:glutaminyl-peptide cyclotransferase